MLSRSSCVALYHCETTLAHHQRELQFPPESDPSFLEQEVDCHNIAKRRNNEHKVELPANTVESHRDSNQRDLRSEIELLEPERDALRT